MREIHTRKVIDEDFILLPYNTVANFNIIDAMQAFFKRKDETKSNILTKIYKILPTNHYLRTMDDEYALIINKETNQLI